MSGELGPEARGILDAGRDGDDPTPGDRARVRASLMQAIAIGGGAAVGLGAVGKASASVAPKAAAGAAAAAKTMTTFGVAKIIGVVAVVAAVGGGGYGLVQRSASREPIVAPSQPASQAVDQPVVDRPVAAARVEDPAPAATAAAEVTANDTDAPPAIEPVAPAPRATVGSRVAATAAPAPGTPTADPLAIQTRQIREAKLAIRSGEARRALTLLDAPAPGSDGQMTEEADATRVDALCKLGRADEAKAAAARFISEHPRSPVVDRMRHPCAEQTGER